MELTEQDREAIKALIETAQLNTVNLLALHEPAENEGSDTE